MATLIGTNSLHLCCLLKMSPACGSSWLTAVTHQFLKAAWSSACTHGSERLDGDILTEHPALTCIREDPTELLSGAWVHCHQAGDVLSRAQHKTWGFTEIWEPLHENFLYSNECRKLTGWHLAEGQSSNACHMFDCFCQAFPVPQNHDYNQNQGDSLHNHPPPWARI